MKRLITILLLLLPTVVFSGEFHEWQYREGKNEMGDIDMEVAFVKDYDYEVDAVLGVSRLRVGKWKNPRTVIILTVEDQKIIVGNSIDVKVDDNEIISLDAVPQGKMCIAFPPKALIHSLKKGRQVKVRFETLDGQYTADFSLKGSAKAINKIYEDE